MSDTQVISDGEFTARFEAVKQECLTGHEAGCTYGGMSLAGSYWLAVVGCPLNHAEACGICGGEPDAKFSDWLDGSAWGVLLCPGCRDRELGLHPETWRGV